MARNEVVTSIRKDKTEYQKKLVKRMKSSPKCFTVMFEASKIVVSVSRVRDTNVKLSENDKETAQILCNQFERVFTNHRSSDLVDLVSESSDKLSALQLFTESIVYKKLCVLNVSKSPSPDAVHRHA